MKKISPPLTVLFSILLMATGYGQMSAAETYQSRLQDLARDFGFEAGEKPGFEEEKFNRLMGRSRIAVARAVKYSERDRLGASAYWLSRSVALSDRATDVATEIGMSGSGYSDDLAGFAAFISQRLFLELEEETRDTLPPWIWMYLGDLHESALEDYGDEDWSGASRKWAFGVRILEWFNR